jgi:hypothetical protein
MPSASSQRGSYHHDERIRVPGRSTAPWAGVLPVAQRYDQPLAAPDPREGLPLPASVQRLLLS